MQGRLYITDNFMCFSCSIIDDKKVVSISNSNLYVQKLKFRDIKQIQKNKLMGLFNSGILIEFKSDSGAVEKYQFGGFENRELALKRIIALWKIRVPEE